MPLALPRLCRVYAHTRPGENALRQSSSGLQHANLGRTPDGGGSWIRFPAPHTGGQGGAFSFSNSIVGKSWSGGYKARRRDGHRILLAWLFDPGVAVFWPAAGIAVGAL